MLPAGRRLRILMYAQHLSGVGHYVRSRELARELAPYHEIHMFDGGRPVPGTALPGVGIIELPRIARSGATIAPVTCTSGIAATMESRRKILEATVTRTQPDVLLIEHYPFSKWELGEEISVLCGAGRALRPDIKVFCSVRDIPRQTQHEQCDAETYASEVLARLHANFDAILVHGDPAMTPFFSYFSRAADIQLPVEFTGIVSEPFTPGPCPAVDELNQGAPFILASIGGGKDALGLLDTCIAAWPRVRKHFPGMKLVLFANLDRSIPADQGSNDAGIVMLPFSTDFLGWMGRAELSVSCAGYNTCANVLATGCRALLIPNPNMSDQRERAEMMARLGAAEAIQPALFSADTLANAIVRKITEPRPHHTVALDGARNTRLAIEQLVVDRSPHIAANK